MDILNSVLSIVLTAVMGYVVWLLQTHKEDKSAEKRALKVLLREDIENRYDLLKDKKVLSKEEYSDFDELCQAYFALKGNGTGKHMHDEIMNKKVR